MSVSMIEKSAPEKCRENRIMIKPEEFLVAVSGVV